MKKLILLTSLLLTSVSLYTQINCNPDPNGPECWAGGVPDVISAEHQILIDNIQQMTLDPTNIGVTLPDYVYNFYKPEWNATNIYLPQIINQDPHFMCSQASIVYYVFTYEINYERNTSAQSNSANIFHPSFTYNFLNGGNPSSGSEIVDGINILKENGCPDLVTYGETNIPSADATKWISGYDKYNIALKNRVDYEEKIDISNINNNNLDLLKYWLFNHNNQPRTIGGVGSVVFENMFDLYYLPFNSGPFANTDMVYIAGLDGTLSGDAHTMTIVGYDDDLPCGSYTGALILANSWGTGGLNPYNDGYVFLPYALINFDGMLRRDTNTDQIWVFVLHVEPDHKTNFTLDVKLLLNDRKFLRMSEGYNTTTGNNVPLNDPNISTLTQFQYGGQFPLLGVDKEDVPMELVLDFDYFVDEIGINIESVDGFFFGARYPDGFASTANFLQEFKLTDHRCDPSFSLSFPTPASLLYNQWDWFGIDYNRLNEAYSSSEIISSEIYSHCLTTIESGATVEFSDNAEILFYDGIIEIEPGATLELEDCHLRLMQGLNKIIVRGNLLFSGDPIFETEGGTLEIEYHNEEFPPIDYEINDATFEFNALNKLKIIGLEEPNLLVEESYIEHAIFDFSGDLTIQDLAIGSKNIVIDFSYGDLLVQNNSSLENTYVLASFPNGNGNSITIQNNEFANNEETNQKAVISIDDYKIFLIENNKIEINHCNGIELYHAGNNVGIDKSVSSNDIYSSTSNNECRGIDVFFSRADISNNYIYNNKYGVVAFGKSETAIMGNQNASSISGTQRFIDNIIHCYFSYSSYPEDIRYNYFEHNTTIDDPYVKLVYYDIMEDPEQPDYSVIYNIECNAWDSTFRPEFDLIPIGSYDYDPYWFIGQYCVKDGGEAGEIYDEAKVFIDSGYYSQADSNFKEIISDFPEDPHAIHSLRELYNIEEFNGNSFDSLRLYYRSVIQANQDSLLCRSADWMSMHCFIKMDSIQKAIDWLDSAINVPQNSVDSIFAIINLGYIYTHYPDTTLRSALFTIHNEHIPKSYRDYKVRREELFSSLLMSSTVGDENREISFDKNAAILQIVPNPTRDAINVKLQVLNEGYLKIDVYSAIGAKTREINLGKVQKGILDRSISLFNQPQGMFYIVVKHNNAVQDTEKVIKL